MICFLLSASPCLVVEISSSLQTQSHEGFSNKILPVVSENRKNNLKKIIFFFFVLS